MQIVLQLPATITQQVPPARTEAELEEFYSIPKFQPPEIITQENFPHLLEELNEPTAATKKDGPIDNDEDIILYEDTPGILIQPKSTARAAQLHALQKEYGLNLPQAFARPAYKWVYSPRFPSGLESYLAYDSCYE